MTNPKKGALIIIWLLGYQGELRRILRYDPLVVKGACQLLQVEMEADEAQVLKAKDTLKQTLAKVQLPEACSEVQKGIDACVAAVETLRVARQAGPSSSERLVLEGVPLQSLSAIGLRDLRGIGGHLQVRTAAYRAGEDVRVALCCGATAQLSFKDLEEPANLCRWQPKAVALQWATKALSLPRSDSSASSICICIREQEEEVAAEDPSRPAKLGRPEVPFSRFWGSRFPYKVANPKKGTLIMWYGYWATKEEA